MILGFKKQFIIPYQGRIKKHSIREDIKKRWKAGRSIQLAIGTRTKHYRQFGEEECISIQKISIYWRGNKTYPAGIFIDGREITLDESEQLALNDGFNTVDDFYNWFSEDFKGVIIHWTDLKY